MFFVFPKYFLVVGIIAGSLLHFDIMFSPTARSLCQRLHVKIACMNFDTLQESTQPNDPNRDHKTYVQDADNAHLDAKKKKNAFFRQGDEHHTHIISVRKSKKETGKSTSRMMLSEKNRPSTRFRAGSRISVALGRKNTLSANLGRLCRRRRRKNPQLKHLRGRICGKNCGECCKRSRTARRIGPRAARRQKRRMTQPFPGCNK